VLFDDEGNRYLDFLSGLAVTSLGHAHPEVAEAIADQAARLLHVSNLFSTEPGPKLAALVDELIGGGGLVFFCNSGAEANEAAIKLARKWAGPGRHVVITADGSFHGRTLATLHATGQPQKHGPFQPLPEGFRHVAWNDAGALADAIDDTVAAVLLEPIQGEGGVWPADLEYLSAVEAICAQNGVLFMVDEVQTGLARTGEWFAFHHYDVSPDVVTMAKALGNGVPIGATWAKREVADAFQPGDHATTFGGQPLAAAAALKVVEVMIRIDAPARATGRGPSPSRSIDHRRSARGARTGSSHLMRAGRHIRPCRRPSRPRLRARGQRRHGNRIASRPASHGHRYRRRRSRGDSQESPLMKHLLEIDDLSPTEIEQILDLSVSEQLPDLSHEGIALVFEMPPARTRNSAEMAAIQLGAHPVHVVASELKMDERETVEDVTRTLALYYSIICARVYDHRTLERMAGVGAAPVVNLLSHEAHPLQALADVLTMRQEFGDFEDRTVTFVGHPNNVFSSLAMAPAMVGMNVRLASPTDYSPSHDGIDRIKRCGADLRVFADPMEAVAGADVIYTDVWVSMGEEAHASSRRLDMAGFTVYGADDVGRK